MSSQGMLEYSQLDRRVGPKPSKSVNVIPTKVVFNITLSEINKVKVGQTGTMTNCKSHAEWFDKAKEMIHQMSETI